MKGWLVGAAVVALAVAAAVLVWPSRESAQPEDPEPELIDYVALGDSFSAGPLIPEARGDPASCFRSTNNYPAYLAGYLDVTSYRDVTCSGASTRDLRAPQPTFLGAGPPPQLDALSPQTDLVTLGIGGNDFGLFGSLVDTCPRVRSQDANGAPCRRSFTLRAGGGLVDTKARDARRVEDRIALGLRAIHRKAPAAEVYVVGYPRLLPGLGRCPAVPFAAGDYQWGGRIARLLNLSLSRAAERGDATYVDLYPASLGHDACAGDEAWVNGSRLQLGMAANFHPFQAGMRGMAGAIYEVVTGRSAPDAENASPPPAAVIPNRVGG